MSFSLAGLIHKMTDEEYHRKFVEYFVQTLISLHTRKEDKANSEFVKLKRSISVKISGAISLFLVSKDEVSSAPGTEVILD